MNGTAPPSDDDSKDPLKDVTSHLGDAAIEKGLGGVWKQADQGVKLAIGCLVAAALAGPLGQGFLAVFKALYSPKLPTEEQIEAVWWLAVLTLPVFLGAAVLVLVLGKMPLPAGLIAIGLAVYFGGVFLGTMRIPAQLGDIYCYNDGTVMEKTCREFDSRGFTANTIDKVGSSLIYSRIIQVGIRLHRRRSGVSHGFLRPGCRVRLGLPGPAVPAL